MYNREPDAMREIHAIMEKLYEKEKDMKPEQILQNINLNSTQLIRDKKLNLEIVKDKIKVPA